MRIKHSMHQLSPGPWELAKVNARKSLFDAYIDVDIDVIMAEMYYPLKLSYNCCQIDLNLSSCEKVTTCKNSRVGFTTAKLQLL